MHTAQPNISEQTAKNDGVTWLQLYSQFKSEQNLIIFLKSNHAHTKIV